MQSQVFPSRFLAEVKSEPSRHLPVSPTHPHSPLNLSRLPRDFPSQATLHLCGCNQGAPRRSAGHRLGSETEPREPVTRQTPGPGPLRGYPGFWRNWSVRRKALCSSKLGCTQNHPGSLFKSSHRRLPPDPWSRDVPRVGVGGARKVRIFSLVLI